MPHLRIVLGVLLLVSNLAAAQDTTRVSVSSSGDEGNRSSVDPAITPDGRFVAFTSDASNLVLSDTNQNRDIFVHDRSDGLTIRVSVDSLGLQANNESLYSSISADGRFVSFCSRATNLVPGDTNDRWDVFVHDRATGVTERVSESTSGGQGDHDSFISILSADGRFVAFESEASNLVAGDTNRSRDIYLRDRLAGTTVRVNLTVNGAQVQGYSGLPDLSSDGRFVTFTSYAANLLPGDTNGMSDIFVKDLATGDVMLVSVSSTGTQSDAGVHDASISADGRFVAFHGWSTLLVPGDTNASWDVFVHDCVTGVTERVSKDSSGIEGNSHSQYPTISASGRFVTFRSDASNLVPGDSNGATDDFLHDRTTGTTERINVSASGAEARIGGGSSRTSITSDGTLVAFQSQSDDLVPGDTNGWADVFLRDRGTSLGSNENTIVLAGEVQTTVGQSATFSWFAAPPGAHYWLLGSWNRTGSVIGGHAFDLGPHATVLSQGYCTPRGTGSFTTAPIHPQTLGRTFYLEIGARDATGAIHDSNTLERTVQ